MADTIIPARPGFVLLYADDDYIMPHKRFPTASEMPIIAWAIDSKLPHPVRPITVYKIYDWDDPRWAVQQPDGVVVRSNIGTWRTADMWQNWWRAREREQHRLYS